MEVKHIETPEGNAATESIDTKCGGKEFDAAAAERAKTQVRAEAEAKLNDAVRAAKEERNSELRHEKVENFIFSLVFSISYLVLSGVIKTPGDVLVWNYLKVPDGLPLVVAVGLVVGIAVGWEVVFFLITAWSKNRKMKRKIEEITRKTETELESKLAFLNENPGWAGKKIDGDVIRAFEHMKNVDPRYPTVKDAVMAVRCADVKTLLTMKKNGFTKWDDPEIMLAACKTPILKNVQTIHQLGGNVNAKNEKGQTALMWAAKSGNIETVKYLVSNGADIKAKTENGKAALMWAARSGNIETVKYLVSQGADVKAKADDGRTVLMWAARSGNIETVKYLVSQGADVNAKDKDGKTALDHAKGECKDYLRSVAK